MRFGRPLVLRVARTPLVPEKLAELERLFAGPVQVDVTAASDAMTIFEQAREPDIDALVIDMATASLVASFCSFDHNIPVLRPIRKPQRDHRGEMYDRFIGYGRLMPNGSVEPLGEGVLARS